MIGWMVAGFAVAGPIAQGSTECTVVVAPDGDDANDGSARERAVRTPARGFRLATPAAVVCLATGRYGTLRLVGIQGTATAPIVVRSVPGERAVITENQLAYGHGILLQDAAHIQIRDVSITQVQVGIAIVSSHHVRIEGVDIEGVGRAGVQVRRKWADGDEPGFTGPPSHHVELVGNQIRDTGNDIARYGEGIYIGSGGHHGDDTHHVSIVGNTVADTRAEGIELKPYTHHVEVRGNEVVGGSHFFHGAITVGAQAFDAPDIHAVIEGNRVHGFRAAGTAPVGGIVVGHGTTLVRDNHVWDIEGPGIRTTTTFANAKARTVRLEGNRIEAMEGAVPIAVHLGDERTGMQNGLAEVLVERRPMESTRPEDKD